MSLTAMPAGLRAGEAKGSGTSVHLAPRSSLRKTGEPILFSHDALSPPRRTRPVGVTTNALGRSIRPDLSTRPLVTADQARPLSSERKTCPLVNPA